MPLYLLPLLPLIGFALLMLFPRLFPGRSAGWLASGTVLVSFVIAVMRYLGQGDEPARGDRGPRDAQRQARHQPRLDEQQRRHADAEHAQGLRRGRLADERRHLRAHDGPPGRSAHGVTSPVDAAAGRRRWNSAR